MVDIGEQKKLKFVAFQLVAETPEWRPEIWALDADGQLWTIGVHHMDVGWEKVDQTVLKK